MQYRNYNFWDKEKLTVIFFLNYILIHFERFLYVTKMKKSNST